MYNSSGELGLINYIKHAVYVHKGEEDVKDKAKGKSKHTANIAAAVAI
jgi:hypothetical protein